MEEQGSSRADEQAAPGGAEEPQHSAGQARICVASRASLDARPAMWRAFRDDGWPIISTWIDEAAAGQTECLTELWSRIEREVTTATALIFYAEPEDFPLKGAYIEVGMAMAAGVPIGVVVPGVPLDPPSYRPVGSWVRYPGVRVFPTALAALDAAVSGVLSIGSPSPEAEAQPSAATSVVDAPKSSLSAPLGGWLEIESAPKDGPKIIAAFDAGFRLACGQACGCMDGETADSHERDAFLAALPDPPPKATGSLLVGGDQGNQGSSLVSDGATGTPSPQPPSAEGL
jgi:hypothetical protein